MNMKEAYQDKMHTQLRKWQAKIDVLKAKADQAGAEQKIKYYEEIESLHEKQRKVHDKLDELRSTSETAWEKAKASVEVAWQDLRESVDRAVEKLK